jgi:hypothetical protein
VEAVFLSLRHRGLRANGAQSWFLLAASRITFLDLIALEPSLWAGVRGTTP